MSNEISNEMVSEISSEMSNEEANKVLEEMQQVRPEMLNNKAKRLFEAIMTIADDRDKAYRMIDDMTKELAVICTGPVSIKEHFVKQYCDFINSDDDCCWKENENCANCIKKYFEERCK